MKQLRIFAQLLVAILTLLCFSGCGPEEPVGPQEPEKSEIPEKPQDTAAPVVKILVSSLEIKDGPKVEIAAGELSIGGTKVAQWSDDTTPLSDLKVSVTLNGHSLSSGSALNDEGTMQIAVTDQSGNTGSGSLAITVFKDMKAPEVKVSVAEINVGSGAALAVADSSLSIGGTEVATWSDDITPTAELLVEVKLNDKVLKGGDMIAEAGTLKVEVTDQNGNKGEGSVAILMDTTAPVVEVAVAEINVGGGAAVAISENLLSIGGTAVATWSDDFTPAAELKVEVKFNGNAVASGDLIGGEGTLTIAVTDLNGNVGEGAVKIVSVLIFGLESIGSLELQVDREVNLLQGVSLMSGVAIEKVEVSFGGARETVADPGRFIPQYPGNCDIFLILRLADGRKVEEAVTGLTIAPLPSATPALREADWLADYAWISSLPQAKQDFIHGHLLTSYVNRQWFRQDITYIIMGEVPLKEDYSVENVGDDYPAVYSSHASDGYRHIVNITPGAKVKACGGPWSSAEKYVKSHPNEKLIFSCAADYLAGDDYESLVDDPNYYSLKNLLSRPNCIVSSAVGNVKTIKSTSEETQPLIQWSQYTSASVSSKLNNKITVCGYYPGNDNIFGVDEGSRRPIGFGRDKVNIVIPFIPLVNSIGNEHTNTSSSYPTGTLSSALGNYLSILIHNNPGWTLNDAMSRMLEKYLYEEPFKYLNDAGQIVNGGTWNFFRCIEFLEDQAIRKDAFNGIKLSGDIAQLPAYKGVVYLGKGVQFEYNGDWYDSVEGNEAQLVAALAAGSGIVNQRWSRDRWLKMGGSGSANGGSVAIEARLVNTACELIPDLSLSSTFTVR